MQLASYKSTRLGLQGIANRIIRLRLRGPYSHTEVVFEPGDGVDHLVRTVAEAWRGPVGPKLRLLPEEISLAEVRAQAPVDDRRILVIVLMIL